MKIHQIFLFFWFGGSVTPQTNNGVYFQQPYVKWAVAHSYSWVIEPKTFEPNSDYRSNFETLTNQVQQQAQQQAQHQVQRIQQQIEDQTRQQPQHQMQQHDVLQHQRQTPQPVQQQQAIQQRTMQAENMTPDELHSNDINKAISNPSLSVNSYNQDFVDEIVRKVMQKTTGDSYSPQPSTRSEIERIVREVLLEYPSNERVVNGMNRDYIAVPNKDYKNLNVNRYGFPRSSEIISPQNEKYFTDYPNTQTENINPQTYCGINCGSIRINDGQPIAVAMANAFHPGSTKRLTNGRMVANSFTYTSV